MILDRKHPPLSTQIDKLKYTKPTSVFLDNGNSLHHIIKKDSNVAKIEIQFDGGYIYQPYSLVASCVNAMLLEGSRELNSKDIAEYFDGEGAFLEHSCFAEKSSITLYCLRRNVKKTSEKLFEIIDNANFEQKEIDNYLKIKKQKFLVNNEKMDFKARNRFLDVLVGPNNSYANSIELKDFESIKRKDLIDFYGKYYLEGKKQIFVSGGVNEEDLGLFVNYLNSNNHKMGINLNGNYEISPSKQNELIVRNDTAIQTAIRIGCITFGKNDPRFPQLFMLNTILGGYFGSRLMKNIREDKGYTYGIGSGIANYNKLSYIVIATEVGTAYTNQTLDEINKEIDYLRNKEVPKGELNLVKNYILGNLLRGFDGAYEAMDRFKGLFNFGLDYSYYENFVEQTKCASAQDIKALARDVFEESKFKQILAGNL